MTDGEATSVRVALRIRPQLAREKIEGCRNCTYVTPGEPQVTLGKDKAFTYDYVFDTPTEQQSIYESCISQLIEGCFEGYNATVLAYGQTGSGKTYTMGTGFDVTTLPEQLGVIPRAMDHLYNGMEKRKREAKENGLPLPEFTVSAQFMELYNDDLIDLFDTSRDPTARSRSNIRIHEDANGSIYTVGVTSRQVATSEETLQCLHAGALNRTTAATQMNSQSSRSHAIFTVVIKQTRACKPSNAQNNADSPDKENENLSNGETKKTELEFETLSAKFHFADLAGSERLKRTGATGDRAKEGISINSGLLALGNVISALGEATSKQPFHVPYRDSKLTRLLQDSLGGNSRTLMVACISPSDSDFMETLNTLRYANRAKNIKNKVVANQDNASKQMQLFRQQIAALQLELTEYKTGKRIVGEDGVEAYNDMFQENNMLQKENNNFRMKIKAMQETLDNRNQRIITLTTELAQANIGATGENAEGVVSMVGDYVKEIEELRSKLLESEALCSVLRRRSDNMAPYGLHRSPTPMSLTDSIDFEHSTMTSGRSVLAIAKEEIDKLEVKKENLRKRKAPKQVDKLDSEKNGEDAESLAKNGEDIVKQNGYEQITSDEEDASEADNETVGSTTTSDEEEDEDKSEALQQEFAELTYEIDVKQQLVSELEDLQRRMSAMQVHYEQKLKLMAETIRATEKERDKVLKNLDSKASGNSERSKKIKADYEKQLQKMKKDMSKLQEAKRSHDRLVREQSRHTSQLKSLRTDLEAMKKAKVRLMRQIKEEQKKSKAVETKQTKEIQKLKRENKMKANEVRSLTSQNRQKDVLMKRKKEEVAILRKQLKPISGKYGKQQQTQQLKQAHSDDKVSRSLDVTYTLDKKAEDKVGNAKRIRKASSEFSSRTAKLKLKTIQNQIEEAVLQRETVSRIEKQMERLLQDRERLQHNIERAHRKRSRAITNNEDSIVRQQLKEDENALQENIDFVNEQIQECQMEIMQIEEQMQDKGIITSIVQYCSVNEARYMLENLISANISKSAIGVQTQNRLSEVETRLQVSEVSEKQGRELLQYILEKRPDLDGSLTDCFSEYMKGVASDSDASSRESSPDRNGNDSEDNAKYTCYNIPYLEPAESDTRPKDSRSSKELKARRRTATPQELLHGMGSPLTLPSPIDSPIDENKTFTAEPRSNSPANMATSTPDRPKALLNKTLTNDIQVLVEKQEEDTLDQKSASGKLGMPVIDEEAEDFDNTVIHKSNSAPTFLPNTSPSTETPPGSPVSSRSAKSSLPANVFSRLTTYAMSSPRSDKGRMKPYASKAQTPRGVPLYCTQVAEGHLKPVLCVQATEHLLFSGSKDRTVKVWNLVTGQEIMTLDGHPNNVNVVRHCPYTGLVFSVSLCYIKVWDIRSRAKCIRVLSSSGGYHLPSNFISHMPRTNRMADNESSISDVKLSADGKLLFCATQTHVKIFELNKFTLVGKLSGHTGNIITLAVPNNGSGCVITGAKDHFIKVYDISGGVQGIVNPSFNLEPPHMDGVESLAFSASENVLFSASRDKSIKKWDMSTKAVLKSEYQAHSSWVCALDIVRSLDGDEVLVSGGRHGNLKLWDVCSFGSIGSIRAHTDTINYIASNKTNIFTASSDRKVAVWSLSPKY